MTGPARLKLPGQSTASPSGFGLPGDLLRESRKRVRIIAILVIIGATPDFVVMVGQTVARLLTGAGDLPEFVPFLYNVVTMASAIGMIGAVGSDRIRDSTVLDLALAFEVFLCLLLSLANPESVYQDSGTLPRMTWVTPLIILFPLIVPCPPRRTLLAAIVSAAMRPIGLLLLVLAGRVQAEADDYLLSVFNPSWPSSSRTSDPGSSTAWASRSRPRGGWAATPWSAGSAAAAWARCGSGGTGCWRGRPR